MFYKVLLTITIKEQTEEAGKERERHRLETKTIWKILFECNPFPKGIIVVFETIYQFVFQNLSKSHTKLVNECQM